VDHLFVLKGDGAVQGFDGKYTQYLQLLEEDQRATASSASAVLVKEKPSPSVQPPVKTAKKLSWREQQEYEGLEMQIETLQEEIDKISSSLAKGINDYAVMMKMTEDLASLEADMEEKSEKWMELAERAEG